MTLFVPVYYLHVHVYDKCHLYICTSISYKMFNIYLLLTIYTYFKHAHAPYFLIHFHLFHYQSIPDHSHFHPYPPLPCSQFHHSHFNGFQITSNIFFSTIGHTLSRIIHLASNVKKFVSNKTKSPFACFRPTVCTQLTSMLLVG